MSGPTRPARDQHARFLPGMRHVEPGEPAAQHIVHRHGQVLHHAARDHRDLRRRPPGDGRRDLVEGVE